MNKKVFYEVNPRFFKDSSGDGVGDFVGLASKFDYFDYLKVNSLILQDVLSTDTSSESQNFTTPAPELGTIDDFIKVIAKANKFNIDIFIEMKLGFITRNNEWFTSIKDDKTVEIKNLVEFVGDARKSVNGLDYVKSDLDDSYYVFDSKTQEIPLNWQSNHVIDKFVEVIKFWVGLGVKGFVFKDFEYASDKEKNEIMSETTVVELKKFTDAIRAYNNSIELIGKSNIISILDAPKYIRGQFQIFDRFLTTSISLIGTDEKLSIDRIGKFVPKHLGQAIREFSRGNDNILSFGSKLSGRIVSRWGNDDVFADESAKGLMMLLMFANSSPLIYYADELGVPNIGLRHTSDFQDRFIDERKQVAFANGVNESKFFDAQVMQNPINSRSLMPWSSEKNYGFSDSDNLITPLSASSGDLNVTKQYTDPHSTLNFSKKLISLINDEKYKEVMQRGDYRVSTLISGLISMSYKYGDKVLKVIVNLTDRTRPCMVSKKTGNVILSTYINKEYKEIPRRLEAYEGVLICNFDKEIKDSATILNKEDKIDIDKVIENLDFSNTKTSEIKEEVLENSPWIDESTKETPTNKINGKEEDMWFRKKQKENISKEVVENLPAVAEKTQEVNIEALVHTDEASVQKEKSTLEIEKEKAIAEREADRSHKDEQTKLTEDQLAKTTLIDDSMDIEDLFKHETIKKK